MITDFEHSYSVSDCRQEFVRAVKEAGIEFRGELLADGLIRRFSPGNSPYNDGYYSFLGVSGAYGDYGRNIHKKWKMVPAESANVAKIEPLIIPPREHQLIAIDKTKGILVSCFIP